MGVIDKYFSSSHNYSDKELGTLIYNLSNNSTYSSNHYSHQHTRINKLIVNITGRESKDITIAKIDYNDVFLIGDFSKVIADSENFIRLIKGNVILTINDKIGAHISDSIKDILNREKVSESILFSILHNSGWKNIGPGLYTLPFAINNGCYRIFCYTEYNRLQFDIDADEKKTSEWVHRLDTDNFKVKLSNSDIIKILDSLLKLNSELSVFLTNFNSSVKRYEKFTDVGIKTKLVTDKETDKNYAYLIGLLNSVFEIRDNIETLGNLFIGTALRAIEQNR